MDPPACKRLGESKWSDRQKADFPECPSSGYNEHMDRLDHAVEMVDERLTRVYDNND